MQNSVLPSNMTTNKACALNTCAGYNLRFYSLSLAKCCLSEVTSITTLRSPKWGWIDYEPPWEYFFFQTWHNSHCFPAGFANTVVTEILKNNNNTLLRTTQRLMIIKRKNLVPTFISSKVLMTKSVYLVVFTSNTVKSPYFWLPSSGQYCSHFFCCVWKWCYSLESLKTLMLPTGYQTMRHFIVYKHLYSL